MKKTKKATVSNPMLDVVRALRSGRLVHQPHSKFNIRVWEGTDEDGPDGVCQHLTVVTTYPEGDVWFTVPSNLDGTLDADAVSCLDAWIEILQAEEECRQCG